MCDYILQMHSGAWSYESPLAWVWRLCGVCSLGSTDGIKNLLHPLTLPTSALCLLDP